MQCDSLCAEGQAKVITLIYPCPMIIIEFNTIYLVTHAIFTASLEFYNLYHLWMVDWLNIMLSIYAKISQVRIAAHPEAAAEEPQQVAPPGDRGVNPLEAPEERRLEAHREERIRRQISHPWRRRHGGKRTGCLWWASGWLWWICWGTWQSSSSSLRRRLQEHREQCQVGADGWNSDISNEVEGSA